MKLKHILIIILFVIILPISYLFFPFYVKIFFLIIIPTLTYILLISDTSDTARLLRKISGIFLLVPINYISLLFFINKFLRDYYRYNISYGGGLFRGSMIPIPTLIGLIVILFMGFLEITLISWLYGKIKAKKQQPVQPQVQTK